MGKIDYWIFEGNIFQQNLLTLIFIPGLLTRTEDDSYYGTLVYDINNNYKYINTTTTSSFKKKYSRPLKDYEVIKYKLLGYI